MKKATLSILTVLSLLCVNTTISISYADTLVKIFKVDHIAKKQQLRLRAYPSAKSRIKLSLPYNAKNITETGKRKKAGKTLWRQISWRNNTGWVNSHYLKKTGVLIRNNDKNNDVVASTSSRNTGSRRAKAIETPVETADDKPLEFGGDRYDQPVKVAATEADSTYSVDTISKRILTCEGNKPQKWNIVMNLSDKEMQIKLPNRKIFSMPISYNEWASENKIRMNVGGDKGRNMVEVNLEKTNSCKTGQKSLPYEVNVTINKSFFSGCCDVAE